MGVEQQRPLLARAREARHEARARRLALHDAQRDPLAREDARQVIGRGALVARWVGRVDSQELLEVVDGLRGRRIPVDARGSCTGRFGHGGFPPVGPGRFPGGVWGLPRAAFSNIMPPPTSPATPGPPPPAPPPNPRSPR